MRKTSLVDAKAHLSTLVDDAEHHRRRTVILRHGKAAAAIVPVGDTRSGKAPPKRLSSGVIRRIFGGLGIASPGTSAVADLLASRR